jgi:hypothetical protein
MCQRFYGVEDTKAYCSRKGLDKWEAVPGLNSDLVICQTEETSHWLPVSCDKDITEWNLNQYPVTTYKCPKSLFSCETNLVLYPQEDYYT